MTEPTEARPAAHTWRPAGSWSSRPTPTTPTSGRPATAARWIDAGSQGWLVCCTSGDQGGEDPDADPLELAALRETGAAGRRRRHRLCRRHLPPRPRRRAGQRPSRCASSSSARSGPSGPTRSSPPTPRRSSTATAAINHTDHRAAGMAAVDAVYPAARNPMAFPWLARCGLAAHKVRRLYLFWSDAATPGSTSRPRSSARSTRSARTPARSTTSRRPGRADPDVGGRGGRADRGGRRRGRCAWSSSMTTRTRARLRLIASASGLVEEERPDRCPSRSRPRPARPPDARAS